MPNRMAIAEFEAMARQMDDSLSGKVLLGAIMAEWGGLADFVAELRGDFDALDPGHPNRLKLQTVIIQAMLKFGEGGDGGEAEEEVLEQARQQLIRELQDESENGDGEDTA